GICPGAAYASLGVGNWPILYALAGMFLGAYLQGVWRSDPVAEAAAVPSDD
ncbi:MAG: YeeE/YedE family protein, partial [Halohasta sp.]